MNILNDLYNMLGKYLPDELIVIILYKYCGLSHPVINKLKIHTHVKEYEDNGITRDFGNLWYNSEKLIESNFNKPLSQFIGGSSIYPHPWTLDRSLKILQKIKNRKCINCNNIETLTIVKLFEYVEGSHFNSFLVPHIYYRSYTTGLMYIEKIYKDYVDKEKIESHLCKVCS